MNYSVFYFHVVSNNGEEVFIDEVKRGERVLQMANIL